MEVETKKTDEETETKIKHAMLIRVNDFKAQADSLTLEGVRRALEKDLGMKTLSLDVHKRFIKQCLEECFYGGDDGDLSTTTENASDPCPPRVSKETPGEKDEQRPKDPKDTSSDIYEGAEVSPAGEEKPKHQSMKAEDFKDDDLLSEDTIKKMIEKRAPYFRANLEKITLAKVRRLLEEDLNLEKNTLDAYKSFISDVLDEVLQSPESAETTNGTKKKPKKALKSKETGKVKREPKVATEDSGSSNLGNDMSESDENIDVVKKPKKRPLEKSKSSMKPMKQHKTSSDDNGQSGSRKKKQEEMDSEKGAESDNEKSTEIGGSSSDERPKKKQEKPTAQAYGKHVERLKSVIKACGMGVPPAVYKRAKQVSDSKRESFLIKELEDILAKEGLSTNPSDKEIKSVKRKKERARELEGIDMSNIVSTSRRRSTINFIPTPKPKIESESDEDEEDEVEDDADDHEGIDDGDNGIGESSEGSEEDAEADEDSD